MQIIITIVDELLDKPKLLKLVYNGEKKRGIII
jgi:hypothetical protein